MTDFPDLKIKALIAFPASILDGTGIDVVKENGSYQFNLAFDDFAPAIASLPDRTSETVLTWNTVTEQYKLASVSALPDPEVLSLSGVAPYLDLVATTGTGTEGPWIYATMGRGTAALPVAVQQGDKPFGISVFGEDGVGPEFASAQIYALVDGPVSDGVTPIAWVFATGNQTPDGGTERLRITSAGAVVIAASSLIGFSDAAFSRVAASVLEINNGTPGTRAFYHWGGQARASSDFGKGANDTTLANVTGLSVNLAAGRTYSFAADLPFTCAAAGGVKAAISGTATATNIIYSGYIIDSAANGIKGNVQATALNTAVANAATTGTTGMIRISGTITVNAAGTLTVQFAQNVNNATQSVVKRGATLIVHDLP